MAEQLLAIENETLRELVRLIATPGTKAITESGGQTRTSVPVRKLWAMLSDVSRAKPDDRAHNPETWKALFMNACGHATRFEVGLEGEPFPVGFRSSRLSKKQMSDLIEFVYAYGTQRGVIWSEPMPDYSA